MEMAHTLRQVSTAVKRVRSMSSAYGRRFAWLRQYLKNAKILPGGDLTHLGEQVLFGENGIGNG